MKYKILEQGVHFQDTEKALESNKPSIVEFEDGYLMSIFTDKDFERFLEKSRRQT